MTSFYSSRTLDRLTRRLLDARRPEVHWTGELSSSALSTATAIIALHLSDADDPLARTGLDWLEATQNADGGFGDTVGSPSNLSTTALCWAAFTAIGRHGPARDRVADWMRRAAGSLEPLALIGALDARYGRDRTFSVPILTVLATARIVPWCLVPQLPFELAVCPRSWFATLGLPVVSYALPALIAIGLARHRRQPSRNVAARWMRQMASGRTLRILEQIQPDNGGYLEATPLTSFVCISLQVAGVETGPVLERGLGFIRRSVRPCGSWPIDTNLATWLTTLSVNALKDRLPGNDREHLARWLLAQQYRDVHPYTGAAPGGWSWTNLPGGVPDADDTSGALIALHHLGVRGPDVIESATSGVRWLLDLQNRDRGIPTFCRGWGTMPFDRSAADITAHAVLAWSAWRPSLDLATQARVDAAIGNAVVFLEGAQRPDGAWTPLWFGNQSAPQEGNPVYGTARVLLSLRRVRPASAVVQRGVRWVLDAQNGDGGWGGDRGVTSTIEETSLAVAALVGLDDVAARAAVHRGERWIVQATRGGDETTPSPIGLYFSRLWYCEASYPLIFAVDALRRVADDTH
jgi:squalene-hopene/tetraprenyl-beta-curcumene cyclase